MRPIHAASLIGLVSLTLFTGCESGGSATSGAASSGTGGAATTGSGTPASTGSTTGTGSMVDDGGGWSKTTVFLLLMENTNWADLVVSKDAPYINGTLVPMASHADQYFNPPGNHPSEPNYVWLEAGDNLGIINDDDPSSNAQSTTSHLVDQLEAKGLTWKAYEEDIPGTDCPLTAVNEFAPKHCGMLFFEDVTNDNSATSARCIAHIRPYAELAADLENNTVADYNFITPNLCDDMHTACAPLNDETLQGDTWLSKNVPAILASHAYQNGGVLFITWDESELGDFPIGMLALSPHAKGGGYGNMIHYTHSSTLRTVQEIFGLSPFLRDAANATDLADLFETLP
jgi:phosphatidylinositol-3-phosphatase